MGELCWAQAAREAREGATGLAGQKVGFSRPHTALVSLWKIKTLLISEPKYSESVCCRAGHCPQMTNPHKSIYSFSTIHPADIIKVVGYSHSSTIVLCLHQISTGKTWKYSHPWIPPFLWFAEQHTNMLLRLGLCTGSLCWWAALLG